MVTVSIILSILAIINCSIEWVHLIIQERRIRRTMKLRLNAVYGKLAYKDVTELTPEELKYMRADAKASKKVYKAIKKAYKGGCSYADTDSIYKEKSK